MSIIITDAKGRFNIPLINRETIIEKLSKIPEKLTEYEVPDEWNLDIKEKPLITSRRNNLQRITFVDTQPKATDREIKELKEEIEEIKDLVYTMK